MLSSRSLSIQFRPVHATPVAWPCVSRESRPSGAIKLRIRSIPSSTLNNSLRSAQTRPALCAEAVRAVPYCGVTEGDGEAVSAPLSGDVLVSAEPALLADPLVSTAAHVPAFGCLI